MTRKTMALALGGAIALAACSSGGDGGGGGAGGSYTMALNGGGSATTLDGGTGGYFYAETYQPGGVKLRRSGQAATAFDVPPVRGAFDAGANGVTVTTSQTASRLTPGAADPGAGVLYVVSGNTYLYKGDGLGTVPDAAERVTGLSIRAGATLQLALNWDTNANGTMDMAYLSFPDDVEIAGVLEAQTLAGTESRWDGSWSTRAATSRDSGAIYVEAEQFFVRPGGLIDLRGGDAAAASDADGGCGGYFGVYAYDLFANEGTIDVSGGKGDGAGDGGHAGVSSNWGDYLGIWVNNATGGPDNGGGMILNKGRLLASGGQGANGGEPAEVELIAHSHVVNTGEISANGGTGTTGYGGNAGWNIELESDYASVLNSGALTQKGGDGATGGGNGGYVYLYSGNYGYVGDVVSSGAISTSGGTATTAGGGGDGGDVGLYAYGAVRTSGALTLAGGAAAGASTAGSGGYVELYAYAQPSDYWYGYALAVRPIQVSGNIVLTGGASPEGTGGAGGSFYVYQQDASYSDTYTDAGIEFLGYRSANLSGGDGTNSGGNAYDSKFNVYTYPQALTYSGFEATPAGPIENEIDVTIKGGSCVGTSGAGSDGGFVYFYVQDDSAGQRSSSIRNSGALDLSGGDSKGTSDGGDSGGVDMYSAADVVNSGRILNRGGAAEDAWGGQGNYWEIWLVAGGNVVNSGSISTTGGTGADGGDGSDGWDYHTGFYAGGQVVNTATLESKGGTSTDGAGGTSGAGGLIELFSQSKPTSSGGRLDVSPGTGGTTPGGVGEIWIDWVNVTPASGIL
jgi:hypothetical protein